MSDGAFIEGDDVPHNAVMIMPFVTVTSKGGPHDDESYACGWEMGALDALLGFGHPSSVAQAIHSSNLAQADLIAMRWGYTLRHTPSKAEGWTEVMIEGTP